MKKLKGKQLLIFVIIGVFLVSAVVLLFFYSFRYVDKNTDYQSLDNQTLANDDNDIIQYTSYSDPEFSYTFMYPADWWISRTNIDTSGYLGTMSIEIESSQTSFVMGIESQFLTGAAPTQTQPCSENNPCGGDNTVQDMLYNPDDFEEFVVIEDETLYISKTGAFSGYYIDGETYARPVSIADLSADLAQIRNGRISDDLHLFGLSDSDERFFIYCSFGSEEAALEYWPEYKEIFRAFAGSIKPVE